MKVLTYSYNPKVTPKECLELKFLSNLAPTFQIVAGATKRKKDTISKFEVVSSQLGDNRRFFLMMIDNNTHPIC